MARRESRRGNGGVSDTALRIIDGYAGVLVSSRDPRLGPLGLAKFYEEMGLGDDYALQTFLRGASGALSRGEGDEESGSSDPIGDHYHEVYREVVRVYSEKFRKSLGGLTVGDTHRLFFRGDELPFEIGEKVRGSLRAVSGRSVGELEEGSVAYSAVSAMMEHYLEGRIAGEIWTRRTQGVLVALENERVAA